MTTLPLMKRKDYLQKALKKETERLAISRYIEEKGITFYELAKSQDLEGIVAKRKDSIYLQGKRTKDWIKIKNMQDDDFVVCGYIFKENHMVSLVLGQYENDKLMYKGHVTMGVRGVAFEKIKKEKSISNHPFDEPVPVGHGNENAVWLAPELVCTVKFMYRTESGGLRHPTFKGLRVKLLIEQKATASTYSRNAIEVLMIKGGNSLGQSLTKSDKPLFTSACGKPRGLVPLV